VLAVDLALSSIFVPVSAKFVLYRKLGRGPEKSWRGGCSLNTVLMKLAYRALSNRIFMATRSRIKADFGPAAWRRQRGKGGWQA
jgi:hypothetical protein